MHDMKTMVTKLTERGQVSVPAAIREQLALRPGADLLWNIGADQTSCIVTIVQKPKRKGARAMLGFASTFRETRTTAEWMKELREGEEP